MKVKVLFFDDIFSDLFRKEHDAEQLVWDDNWVSSIEEELTDPKCDIGTTFKLAKSGEIESWHEIITNENPDILLLDLFWPEQAKLKYNDKRRGMDISLETIPEIRKAFPSLPIVCYTVKPDQNMLEKAYRAGVTLFLEKVPLALPEVHSSLKYIFIYLLRQVQDPKR